MSTSPRTIGDFRAGTGWHTPAGPPDLPQQTNASQWFAVPSDNRNDVDLVVTVDVTSLPAGDSVVFTLQADPYTAAGMDPTFPLPDVAGTVLATSSAVTSAPASVVLSATVTPQQARGHFRLAWTLSGFGSNDVTTFVATVQP